MIRPFVLALPAIFLLACSTPKVEPVIESAAAHPVYAEGYPAALTAAATGFGERQNDAKKVMASFNDFPGKLKDPKWDRVLEVIERADEVGRTHAYVDRIRRVDGAHVFFETEKDELGRKVAGSAQYVIKQKGSDIDVSGAIVSSMRDSVDKQLEKELRATSDAHRLIDRYKNQIKKENVPELEKQADAIEFTSYLVHVELVEQKLRITWMLQEGDDVKRAGDRFIEDEKAFQAEKGTSEPDKKESAARIAAMQKSQANLEAALTQARDLAPKLEQEIQDIQKQYDDAIAGLRTKIKEKGGS